MVRFDLGFRIPVFVFAAVLVLAGTVAGSDKLDRLLVYGDGWLFGVREPDGWHGDTENASKLQANIVFYAESRTLQTATTLIYIQISRKVDNNLEQDMKSDMAGYRKRYPEIRFRGIPHTMSSKARSSKLFEVPGEFCEYVTYLNPGQDKPIKFGVSMNVQKREATEAELQAYQKIIDSLSLLKP